MRFVGPLVALSLLALACPARAELGTGSSPAVRRDDLPVERFDPLHPTPLDDDPMRHWVYNPVRPFLAVTADVGWIYARPTVMLGYGRPHYQWVGLELLPQLSQHFVGLYAGWRAAFPWLEVRAGFRHVRPLFHPQLAPARHHDERQLEIDRGTSASYDLLELEALPELRAGPGFVFGAFTAYALRRLPDDADVYEETMRVIVRGNVLLRARLGYLFDVRPLGRARLGPAAEILEVPGRPEGTTFRAGLMAVWRMHEQVDIMIQLLPALVSPDALGILGADVSQLGLRYRFATPDRPGPAEN
jgi:hypothetical protein